MPERVQLKPIKYPPKDVVDELQRSLQEDLGVKIELFGVKLFFRNDDEGITCSVGLGDCTEDPDEEEDSKDAEG